VRALRPRLAATWLGLAGLLSLAGCRCNVDDEQAQLDTSEKSETPTIDTRARTQALRTLVVSDASQLDGLDLSTVESLDLSLSERDGHERPLPDGDPDPEPAEADAGAEPALAEAEIGELGELGEVEEIGEIEELGEIGELGETGALEGGPARTNPRCDNLDLHDLAERAPRLQVLRISGCQGAVHAGLSAFGGTLRELELVDLELDAVTVARLAQLHGLESLSLTRVHAEPDALNPLGRKISPTRLVLRELADDSPVSELVRILPNVRDIEVIGTWVAHNTMIRIGKARRLERLAVIDTNIQNYSLHQIKGLDHLRELVWSGTGFNNQTPVYLRELPLDTLICNCPRLGDTGLHHMYLLPGLGKLVLERSDVSSAGLAELGVLSRLSDLTIRYRDLDAEAFAALSVLPLERLILGPGKLLEPSAAGLGALVRLRELEIDLEGFGDAAAAQLATLVALERLGLGDTEISDEGLVHFAALTSLERLELHHTRVTKHGLESLRDMHALEVLELDHTDIVDEGVAHLAGLTSLRELRLDHTLITDAALPYLLGLERLERLNLENTVVTAQGVMLLQQLPNLEAVNLEGTRAVGN
jgi:hypothetical protein